MIPSRRRFLKNAAKLFDISVLLGAFIFATMTLFASPHGVSLRAFMAMRVRLSNGLLLALLLIIWHNLFVVCGLYASKRLTRRRDEAFEVCKATLLASAFLFISGRIFHRGLITPSFVVVFWVVATWVMVSGRLLARYLMVALRRRGRNSRYILIVGTNQRALNFVREITEDAELGYKVIGFVDDDWAGLEGFEAGGHKRCCNFAGLAEFLRHNVVDEAAMYLPLRSFYAHAAQLVAICEQHGIVLRFESQVFNLKTSHPYVQDLDENSQLVSVSSSSEAGPAMIKRIVDCVCSAGLLLLVAPLLLIVAALVKLTSPGPVLFRQTRVGLNKRRFTIYKFRTMIANAEQVQDELLARNEMSGPVFKIKKDPRITPLGRILRKSSIDELPQLFNVLKGDMSLVGPRAMSLRDYQLFDQDWQRRRFSVKPGITCLWQVNGRSSLPFDKWMELDMQYIDKWSLWLDLKILARTVPAVLRGTGAA